MTTKVIHGEYGITIHPPSPEYRPDPSEADRAAIAKADEIESAQVEKVLGITSEMRCADDRVSCPRRAHRAHARRRRQNARGCTPASLCESLFSRTHCSSRSSHAHGSNRTRALIRERQDL